MVVYQMKVLVAGAVVSVGIVAACQAMDQQQNHHETKVVGDRIAMIMKLEQSGISHEEAKKTVDELFDRVEKRNTENSAISKFCTILNPLSTMLRRNIVTRPVICEVIVEKELNDSS